MDKLDIDITCFDLLQQSIISTNRLFCRFNHQFYKNQNQQIVLSGIIRRFSLSINLSILRYSSKYYTFIKKCKTIENITNHLNELGKLILEISRIGGTLMIELAV